MLIIEDSAPIAAILARHVTSAGHSTTVATDGQQGLAAVAQRRPDCILLDLMMPGMSGTEVLQHLRDDPATAAIPIVLVSAQVGEGDVRLRAELHADFSVGKPFNREQVVGAVRAALAQSRAPKLEPGGA